MPFFIKYDVDDRVERWRAWYEEARHARRPRAFSFVEVGGDEQELRAWLGDADVPVRVAGGEPGLRAAGIETDAGEIVIRV
jgi:hypothetical protein